jgi:hypothetical protein
LLVSLGVLCNAVPLHAGCNLPPIPRPGQTVIWAAANSPFQICADLTIPRGGRVIVEPGVELQFQAHTLTVSGILNARGQAGNHIIIRATSNFPPAITLEGGSINMTFADVTGQIRGGPGKMTISDTTFIGANGLLYTLDILPPSLPPVFTLTRCTFLNTQMQITDTYLKLRNCRFTNTVTQVLRGYASLRGVNTVQGQPLSILRETFQAIQPLFVDGVHASNVSTAGGISLTGGSFFLGPANVLQGNLYPVDIEGGLLPNSAVPRTGNTNNMIWAHDGGSQGVMRWANLGLPYLVTNLINGGGPLTIDPGVTVKFDTTVTGLAGLSIVSTRRVIAKGLPNQLITFDALNPAAPWDGLHFDTNYTEGSNLDYVIVNRARFGVTNTDNFLQISNSIVQNNQIGVNTNTFGILTLSKTRVFNNLIGAQSTPDGSLVLSAPNLLSNWFQGNGTAVENQSRNVVPAERNYWGHPTGPRTPQNPGGQGDPITGPIDFQPFLTAPPAIANNPPVVDMVPFGFSWYGITTILRPPEFVAEAGEKLILRWNLSNSANIASQRVLLSPSGPIFDLPGENPIVLANNLPPNTTSFEATVPAIAFQPTNINQFLRIVAIDGSGQRGWDQTPLIVPSGRITGNIQITSNYSGQTFIGGHPAPAINWTGSTNGTTEEFIFLESDGGLISLFGGHTTLPILSTDTARLVVLSYANSNDIKWFFSNSYFSIRPDPALGLRPPQVDLTSPTPGSVFSGGSVVPITWTASAPEGLRSFDIQVSTNGGKTFHLITTNLAATSRSFNWRLPASSGIPDVRVRVITRDKWFQNSSDGANVVFSIVP